MNRIGDDQAGFSVEFDAEANTIRVRAWGFWNASVATAFAKIVGGACAANPRGAALVMDMSELKPMREEGQKSFGELLCALPKLGVARTSVTTASQLTKLQLLRLANEYGAKDSVQFVTA